MAEEEQQQQVDENKRIRLQERARGQKNLNLKTSKLRTSVLAYNSLLEI